MNPHQDSPGLKASPTKAELKPWKTIGYRGYSDFLSSDNNFLIFRRFGALNARLLLYLQDEIAQLESELRGLENFYLSEEAADIHNGSFRQESLPQRSELLAAIHVRIRQYSKLTGPKSWSYKHTNYRR